MFRYHKGNSREEVAALFGDGIRPTYEHYVEDSDTGDLLVYVGGLGPEDRGRVYLLRWRGRTVGLHSALTRHEGDHGTYRLLTLTSIGTSVFARNLTRVAPVELAPDEAALALRVAAEASVVFESYLGLLGPDLRVSDPDGSGRELSPTEFGYPEITRVPRDLV